MSTFHWNGMKYRNTKCSRNERTSAYSIWRYATQSALLLVAAVACGDVTTPASDRSSTTMAITQELSAALTTDKKFVLRTPPLGSDEIGAERAGALAVAYVNTYGAYMSGILSADHGAKVLPERLRRCGETFYASSPYESASAGSSLLANDPVSAAARRFLGAVWMVSFCQNGVPTASIAVSTLASDVSVVGGRIQTTPIGNTFFSTGIPIGEGPLPMTPEAAVLEMASRTGRRVASIPELIRPPAPFAPQLSRWRMRLDEPITFVGSSSHVRVTGDDLYIGFGETWHSKGVLARHASQIGKSELKAQRAGKEHFFALVPRAGFASALELVKVTP